MRDLAIHIRRSDLLKAMEDSGIDISSIRINDLFKKALNYSIRNRVMVISKSGSKKKVERYIEASTNLIVDFNRIYQGVVVANDIKSMAINKSSVQYLTLTEVTSQAVEFCQLFDIGYETGFKLYIELGLKILKNKFGIYRLKGCASRIVETYKDEKLITEDVNPKGTDIMATAWSTAVRTYFNMSIYIESNVRAEFIRARIDADSVDADYYDWMYAQFEKWQFLNKIPAFSQLYGDNAKLVYQMYMAKAGNANESKQEKEYFKLVKNATKKEIPSEVSIEAKRIRKERLQESISRTGSDIHGGNGVD